MAEIAEINQAASGHVYLDLVEKSANKIVAKLAGVIWHNKFMEIYRRFGRDTNLLLKKGNKVLIRGNVDFHPVYGMKLTITDLDPSATLGELELRRLAIIRELQEAELMEVNSQLHLPLVLQRVAVISSSTAAGYGDFTNHLMTNPYRYKVNHQLFHAAMQGDRLEDEVLAQLAQIERRKDEFDVVVIIRGGGSKLDLHGFNNLEIGKKIATFPLPVLTGIGHQQDETVADMVSHSTLKTPTAVAEFIIDSFVRLEEYLLGIQEMITNYSKEKLYEEQILLSDLTSRFRLAATHFFRGESERISNTKRQLQYHTNFYLKGEKAQLEFMSRAFDLFDVEKLLKRGFSITRLNGKSIRNTREIKKGDELITQLADGEIKSEVV